jgi:cytidylate kinase
MPAHTYLDKGLTIFQTRMQEPMVAAPTPAGAEAQPFITLSREAYAGATTLGQILIPMLEDGFGREHQSWMFLDRNLLNFALSSHQLPERLADVLPEDRISEIKAIIGELVGLHPPLWELEEQIGETIRHLARSGRVIFVGRAGHLITKSLPGGFHVRLVASKETRIRRMMADKTCDWAAAQEFVDSTDLARRRFVKTKFGTDIDDPHTYDLVVNTDLMPPETVAAVVMEGFKQRRMARSVRS